MAEATDAALFVEARIQQENLHFVYEEPPDPYPVWGDPARLHQVFINILDNAIKYSEPGGTIFLILTRTPVTVTVTIRDQGRGIAPDDLDKVKQKFFKAKNSVRGSGIGLAVVDEIVQALGGHVDIESTLGREPRCRLRCPFTIPGRNTCTKKYKNPHKGKEHLCPRNFRTSVGGQALMEGIMMRGPEKICCAVRRPDGTIDLSYDTVHPHWYNKVPLVRGVCNMAENLYKGYQYLMHAADIAMEGETEPAESKFDQWLKRT